jgi:hypothetical protein
MFVTEKNKENFSCSNCNFLCSSLSYWNVHISTAKHIKLCQKVPENLQKVTKTIYECSNCNFNCIKITQWNKHISTIKHKNNISDIKIDYNCDICNKKYLKKSAFLKHNLNCKILPLENIEQNNNNLIENELDPINSSNELYISIINKLVTENKELRNFVIEQTQEYKKDTKEIMDKMSDQIADQMTMNNKLIEFTKVNGQNVQNTTVNGNVQNNNKFNINLFLNEKCKDAMNFADFIKNITVSHEDLENNAQLGFANGISKIIMDNLNQLNICDRPIHCSDVKRETMYIKDDDKWEKEEDTKKLTSAIQDVSRKSVASLLEWQETNPEFEDMDSDFSNNFITMMQQSIAGNKRDALYPKVIRSLAKETMIDKAN